MTARLLILVLLLAGRLLPAPPSPESFFGHRMGADRKLIAWDKVVSYFQALDKASDRVQVRVVGQSTEGRPFIAAYIASPETLSRLEQYRQIQKKLADPRVTPMAEAEQLFTQGKAVVMITCSIHSTEVASTFSAIEYAHRLATENTPKTRAILDNTIFILVPSLNPDGIDLINDWYTKTLGTRFEGTSPPELYQKYVGHDNNRDWYIFSQAETRVAISQLHNVWHPQIVYDVHQQSPFAARMFIPPWMDPIDPNIDPILVQNTNMIGTGIAADLTASGKTGVVVNAIYDFWTPGRHYQAYHAGMRILSEAASVRLASPMTVKPDQISQSAQGYHPRQHSWNHLEPWLGGQWRLRDIVDYQLITYESVLFQSAMRRADLLRSFYRIGERAAGRSSPYAFVIPKAQTDPGSARKLLETLDFGLVEIDRLEASFESGGKSYPAGSFVVRMQQPYSSFAKTLLERQQYPDLRLYPGGPPKRPYDVTAHTLPLLMGVQVDTLEKPVSVKLARAKQFNFELDRALPAGKVLAGSDVDSWKEVNRVWRTGATVWRDSATGDFTIGGAQPAGSVALKRPRVGLFKSFAPSMDEGWTRWLLEQFGFEYKSVNPRDIRAGNLRATHDVLLFPDQSPASIIEGYSPGSMPDEFTGGVGSDGAQALKQFAAEGGTLVFWNQSTEYATAQLGLNAKNTLQGVDSREFYCPGSLLNVTLERHPLTLGVPQQIAVWAQRSPAWEVSGESVSVLGRYPASNLLASGWLLGEKHLAGRPMMLEAATGKGKVVLFGFRPQYRAQSYQTFKLLFNALTRF